MKHSVESFLENISSFFLSNPNSSNFHFSVGSHANIERIYALTAFSKRRSSTPKSCIRLQNEYTRNINFDVPFFYSLNRSFKSLADGSIGGVLFIGTNPRYEASLFNTTIRREQIRRALPIRAINIFSSLRYNYFHGGNSLRSLQSIFENRFDQVSQYRVSRANYSIFRGAERSRRSQGNLFHSFFIILARRLFGKTSTYANFGTIHSSVASRAFAFLGTGNFSLKTIKSSINPIEENNIFLTVDSSNLYKKNIIGYIAPVATRVLSFSTHQIEETAEATHTLPLTSLYERSGHFYILEGRFRKHYKTVTKPKSSRNLETALTALCRVQSPEK
jgi:NADH dehydrogenase/NADH:ubiquinone oxidoreductase subunit G